MAFKEFTQPKFGYWTVVSDPPPINECPGHQITISGTESAVTVACRDDPENHTWCVGKYDPDGDRITFRNDAPICWVTCPSQITQVQVSPKITGSWTADDSGRKPGKH
jgi:hypothetical protein